MLRKERGPPAEFFGRRGRDAPVSSRRLLSIRGSVVDSVNGAMAIELPRIKERAVLKSHLPYISRESRLKSSRTAWINAFLRGSCPLGVAANADSR